MATQASPGTTLAPIDFEDRLIRPMVSVTFFWSLIGMAAGVLAFVLTYWPTLDADLAWLSLGRIRTLNTNFIVFGFGGSALMLAAFYTVQRTCHTRLFAPNLAWFTFAGWQLTLLVGALTLLLGTNQGKEYAELPWIVDLMVTVVWVCFAVVFFGTIAKHRIISG